MRVKRLEIQGFKSFKDKTVIHFDQGITGIVGPNGCGKSNIVDAFFWVMGEQSYKHMRGSSSDDLIFNGSSKYNPLGMAEATLVLETDVPDTANAPSGATVQDIPLHLRSKEVSVTRRLYREGEGEYFINGLPARLKDIQELFMDTGVGAKGYSVIEQGQIGKIVNAKPEDRRLLIEEAAGIAKYKARKKESLRKMEAAQGNLARLNDVVQEIERGLASLERQAQKARLYRKYKDELLDKEMTWGRRKALVHRQKLEALQKDKLALEQELVGLRAELQTAENSIETDRVEQVTDTKQAEDLQSRIQQLSDDLARERSALDLSRRRQGDLAAQLQALDAEKAELTASIASENARVAEHEAGAARADAEAQAATARARETDEAARKARDAASTARSEHDAAQRELMMGITRASDLTSRAAGLASRVDSARAQTEKLLQQSEAHARKLAQTREEFDQAGTAAGAARSRRDALQAEKKTQAARVQQLDQAAREKERAAQDAQKQRTQLQSRLESLEELARAHEGFSDGPKAALDWAQAKGRELFALADAFEIEPGYEMAVEGWLASHAENLVSEDAALALEAIAQLKAGKQGRAAIHVAAPGARTADEGLRARAESAGLEVLGALSEFVKVHADSPLAKLSAQQLIENVVVVRSLAGAQLDGIAAVDLEGASIDAQGVLRGGSASDGAASHLKRKQAIAELRAQLAIAENAAALTDKNAANAREELELARARQQALQTELQAAEVESAALERDVHQTERALKDAESVAEIYALEMTEMREDAARAHAERAEVEAQLAAIVGGRSGLEEKIARLQNEVATLDAALREREAELQTARVAEAQLSERSGSLRRELEAGRALIRDRERRLADIHRTLERATGEQAQFSGGDSGHAARIEELTLALSQTRESLSAVKDRLEQSGAKLNAALERIKQLHHAGDAKTAQANALALELEKTGGDLAHLVQNLEEKYGPGCLERPVTSPIQDEMTEPVVTAEMTAEEERALGEEVERLRERIRRLGEVNVMAIEEFEEASKRHEHLVAERQDLVHSIENLEEAIEHINKTSEIRFQRAFDAIADRFERLFPIIFGGGQAKLSLVYPEGSTEILDAGVDILAQPPGKKIVNIGLLSGGEKALTAVSLIFAIFMVKPSPFCVLDEVDAPLDDANIGKFNALLREMAVKSQFILITHNKKTMELNDSLYGVTMEEPGVSKMVSIRMQ